MMQIRRTNGYNKHINMNYKRKDQQLPNPQRYLQQDRYGAMGFHDNNKGYFQKFPPRHLGRYNNCCQLGHCIKECLEFQHGSQQQQQKISNHPTINTIQHNHNKEMVEE